MDEIAPDWEALAARFTWLDILEVLRQRGWEGTWRVRSTGPIYLCCVFHQEKTPSLVLYPQNRFKCYGCGHTGGIIDFCSALYRFSRVDLERGRGGMLVSHTHVASPEQLLLPLET